MVATPVDTPQLTDLQRLTTRYIESEDRVRITGACSSGDVQVLWLTQRLLSRLLPHLFTWLDAQVSEGRRTHDEAPQPPLPPEQVARQQRQEQLSATAAQQPRASVQATPDSRQMLVQAVDLARLAHGLRLTFKASNQPEAHAVRLNLPPQALRQWLRVLHGQYRRAGWPLQIWPAWIRSEPDDATASSPPARVLH